MYRVPQYWNIDGRIFAFDMFYDGVTYRIFHNMSGGTIDISPSWRTNSVANTDIPSQGSIRPGANHFLVGTYGATATSLPPYSSVIFSSSTASLRASNISVPARNLRGPMNTDGTFGQSIIPVRPVGSASNWWNEETHPAGIWCAIQGKRIPV